MRGLIPRELVRNLRALFSQVHHQASRSSRATEAEPQMLQLSNPFRAVDGWAEVGYLDRVVAAGKQLMGNDIEYAYDQLFFKPSGTAGELLWHSDAGYGWPGLAGSRGLTSWLAITEATKTMGTMQFLPKSHVREDVKHVKVPRRDPVSCGWRLVRDDGSLGRDAKEDYHATTENAAGQLWRVEAVPIGGAMRATPVDPDKAVTVEYQPGDVSFHHGRTLHYTGANTSARDRCALSTHLWPSPNFSPARSLDMGGSEAERLRSQHSPGSPLAAKLATAAAEKA